MVDIEEEIRSLQLDSAGISEKMCEFSYYGSDR